MTDSDLKLFVKEAIVEERRRLAENNAAMYEAIRDQATYRSRWKNILLVMGIFFGLLWLLMGTFNTFVIIGVILFTSFVMGFL